MHLLFAEDQPQLRRSAREYALLEYLIRNKGGHHPLPGADRKQPLEL